MRERKKEKGHLILVCLGIHNFSLSHTVGDPNKGHLIHGFENLIEKKVHNR